MVRSNMYMLYRSTYYITKENILFISTSIDADGQIFTMQIRPQDYVKLLH